MKTLRMTFLLLLTGIFWGTAQTALAQRGSETATGTFFDQYVTPKAKGTKVKGTLAITYVQNSLCCTKNNRGNTYPIMRTALIHRQTCITVFDCPKVIISYPFSSVLTQSSVLVSETEKQAGTAIIGFINSTVIPIIFQQPPTEDGFNNVWFVKSIKNIAAA